MKLNKHGWGLREMLILSGILIIFLGVSIYLTYVLYNSFNKEMKNNYDTLESNLKHQASVYLDDYYDDDLTSDKITITRSVLRSYDLDTELKDKNNKDCSGYVIAYKTMGITHIDPYIKCEKYESKGYEEWRSN